MPPRAEEFESGRGLDASPRTGFTLTLLETIEASKAKMDRWVDIQKAKIDEEEATYNRTLEKEQKEIDDLASKIMRAQFESGSRIRPEEDENQTENLLNRKAMLEIEQTNLAFKIDSLKMECKNRKKRVEEISLEEKKQRLRAEEARILRERVQDAKKTTVDDLTRGIVYYKHLGLDFKKTDGENELQFMFTQLDPKDPTREFSFVLKVDKHDKYEVYDCKPSVDASTLLDVEERLNQEDDYVYLARTMRQAFAETVAPLQDL